MNWLKLLIIIWFGPDVLLVILLRNIYWVVNICLFKRLVMRGFRFLIYINWTIGVLYFFNIFVDLWYWILWFLWALRCWSFLYHANIYFLFFPIWFLTFVLVNIRVICIITYFFICLKHNFLFFIKTQKILFLNLLLIFFWTWF